VNCCQHVQFPKGIPASIGPPLITFAREALDNGLESINDGAHVKSTAADTTLKLDVVGRKMPVAKAASEDPLPGLWAGLLTRVGIVGAHDRPQGTTLETCRMSFFDREQIEGALLGIDHDARMIEIQVAGTKELQRLSFEPAREVRFMHPVELKSSIHGLREGGLKVEMLARKAPFTISFRDGKMMTGELYGYTPSDLGLAVYLVDENKDAVRVLFPGAGVESVSIGEPLGELLVESAQLSREGLQRALERQRELRKQRLGDLLLEKRIVSPDQLAAALRAQGSGAVRKLGEVLVEMGLVSEEQIEQALAEQRQQKRRPLGEILMEMGLVDAMTLRSVLAQKLGIPWVDLRKFRFDTKALRLVPRDMMMRLKVVPLYLAEGTLAVAMENPMDFAVIDAIRFSCGQRIAPVLSTGEDINHALSTRLNDDPAVWTEEMSAGKSSAQAAPAGAAFEVPFESSGNIGDLANQLSLEQASGPSAADAPDDVVRETDNTLVKLVNKIIVDAHQQGASDVHIEPRPGRGNVGVRFRRDGVLREYLELPAKFRSAVISRIKIMANLDISERRKAQDGKIDFKRFGPAKVELRVATIPTNNGLEEVVLRLLAAAEPKPLEALQLSPRVLTSLRAAAERPYGLILVCGPTGSGKTTTLHSVLSHLNDGARKIWTAEDPVEITQAGLSQVQVNAKIGWTFATALRAFLRADPDVVMVGEMRDEETARIAVEASLTGHLVLSTLHTNSAPESITRLLDMGLDPFSFGDALLGVLAQRLARRICPHCAQHVKLESAAVRKLAEEYCAGLDETADQVVARWNDEFKGEPQLVRAAGCDRCDRSGYKGRLALHELLVGTPELRRLIHLRSPAAEIARCAITQGMRTLRHDGIEKALLGLTTLEQVRAISA
jgi:type II secretory ATPase GspE/PulE/Tfp pilus assembly ATPase PilB-like protein